MDCLFLLFILFCCGNRSGSCGNCVGDDCCEKLEHSTCDNHNDNQFDNACSEHRHHNHHHNCDCATPFTTNNPPRRPYADNERRNDYGCENERREPRIFPPYSGETCGCEE